MTLVMVVIGLLAGWYWGMDARPLNSSGTQAALARSRHVSLGPPPAHLGLDTFYAKYLDADGIPVIGSRRVDDEALYEATALSRRMLVKRPDARKQLIASRIRIGIIGRDEMTTDLPEYRDLYRVFPGTDWNARTRGVGATLERPVSSVGEENLLRLPTDVYQGESIFIHEFAHTIGNLGVIPIEPAFKRGLDRCYEHAKAAGLWQNTYAVTNVEEYWAEGVQCWFDANLTANPSNGIHNEIGTREQLKAYDPDLAELISRVFRDDRWRYGKVSAL